MTSHEKLEILMSELVTTAITTGDHIRECKSRRTHTAPVESVGNHTHNQPIGILMPAIFKLRMPRLAASLFLLASAAVLTTVPSPLSADTPHPEVVDLDEELTSLIRNRETHFILDGLKSGRIPLNHLYGGEIDLLRISAYAKFSDLFSYLISNDAVVNPRAIRYIFSRSDHYIDESISIIREYFHLRYLFDSKFTLDAIDSVGILIFMCTSNPFIPDEVSRIFEGLDVNISSELSAEISGLIDQGGVSDNQERDCMEAVLDWTS
jgi:hypothetical protein